MEKFRLRNDLLEIAEKAWCCSEKFRSDRERNKRYTYGRQWDDVIEVNGRKMREEDYIREQGHLPLKNNLIRRLVRNVLGVFRSQWRMPQVVVRDGDEAPMGEVLNRLLHYNMDLNDMEELYARTLEEFLISGFAVHRKWYGKRKGRVDCWTDCVAPENFFLTTSVNDFRGWDADCVGEIHDMNLSEICTLIAKDVEESESIREIYEALTDKYAMGSGFGSQKEQTGFRIAKNGLCRVVELWKREYESVLFCRDLENGNAWYIPFSRHNEIDSQNKEREKDGKSKINTRWELQEKWRFYYLSPEGHLLLSGDSPYPGFSHPYVFKAYPYLDGEIHSFVADVIDQQRYTNRLISLYDWIMRASAKGVLLFPEGALPEGGCLEEVADQWARFNGILSYRAEPGMPLPQQVSNNATNIGITELLQIQLKMFEDISGVNGALQGKLESGSMSGTLYNQQTRNSMTALQDLLSTFQTFVHEGTMKDVANIRHFYDEKKVQRIAGKESGFVLYDTDRYIDGVEDFRIE